MVEGMAPDHQVVSRSSDERCNRVTEYGWQGSTSDESISVELRASLFARVWRWIRDFRAPHYLDHLPLETFTSVMHSERLPG